MIASVRCEFRQRGAAHKEDIKSHFNWQLFICCEGFILHLTFQKRYDRIEEIYNKGNDEKE